jgi:hypothetical protein
LINNHLGILDRASVRLGDKPYNIFWTSIWSNIYRKMRKQILCYSMKINILFTIEDASVKWPNFCFRNGLKMCDLFIGFLEKKRKTHLLCRHKNSWIEIGIISSLSDDKHNLGIVSWWWIKVFSKVDSEIVGWDRPFGILDKQSTTRNSLSLQNLPWRCGW